MKVTKPLAAGLFTRPISEGLSTRLVISLLVGFPFEEGAKLLTDAALFDRVARLFGPEAPLDLGLPKPKGELIVTGEVAGASIEPLNQGFFAGNERFTITRAHGPITGALPSILGRVFVTTAREPSLREVPLALDTVHLFVADAWGALIFRGLIDVEDELGEEVSNLVAALDDRAAPRPLAHYEAVLAARLDPERGHEVALRDEDLAPTRLIGVELRASIGPARAALDEQRGSAMRAREAAEAAIAERCAALGLDATSRSRAAPSSIDALSSKVAAAVAHHVPPPDRAPASAALRDALTEAAQRKERVERRDLSGADLSNLELDGIDLAGALLTGADLSGTSLAGANLEGASLARANLNAADLSGALLTGANLGGSRLRGALLRGVQLRGVTLVRADLSGAEVEGADLTAADLSEVVLAGANLRGVIAPRALVLRADLANISLGGATLDRASILSCDMTSSDLSRASLVSAVLLGVKADRSILREAKLDNLRVVEGSSLRGADLSGASLRGANLRGVDLSGATLVSADLSGADLSGANLAGADMRWVTAIDTRFIRADLRGVKAAGANLMLAIAIRANLKGADLSGANLHRADLTSVTTDGETSFERALMTNTRFEPIASGADR